MRSMILMCDEKKHLFKLFPEMLLKDTEKFKNITWFTPFPFEVTSYNQTDFSKFVFLLDQPCFGMGHL